MGSERPARARESKSKGSATNSHTRTSTHRSSKRGSKRPSEHSTKQRQQSDSARQTTKKEKSPGDVSVAPSTKQTTTNPVSTVTSTQTVYNRSPKKKKKMTLIRILHYFNFPVIMIVVAVQLTDVYAIGIVVLGEKRMNEDGLAAFDKDMKRIVPNIKKNFAEYQDEVKPFLSLPIPCVAGLIVSSLMLLQTFVALYATQTGKLGFLIPTFVLVFIDLIIRIVGMALLVMWVYALCITFDIIYMILLGVVFYKEKTIQKGLSAFKEEGASEGVMTVEKGKSNYLSVQTGST